MSLVSCEECSCKSMALIQNSQVQRYPWVSMIQRQTIRFPPPQPHPKAVQY